MERSVYIHLNRVDGEDDVPSSPHSSHHRPKHSFHADTNTTKNIPNEIVYIFSLAFIHLGLSSFRYISGNLLLAIRR